MKAIFLGSVYLSNNREVYIRSTPLPNGIKGITYIDPDGEYNIYLNCNLDRQARWEALNHELKHINKRHFNDFSVREAESYVVS